MGELIMLTYGLLSLLQTEFDGFALVIPCDQNASSPSNLSLQRIAERRSPAFGLRHAAPATSQHADAASAPARG
jgi:hypothetical protein